MAKRVIFPSFDNPIVLFELTIDSNGVTSVTNKDTGLPATLNTNAFDENTTVNPASTYMEQLISKVSTFILSAPDNTTFEVNNNNGTLSILNANTNTEVTSYSLSSIGATYPNVISSVLSTLDALIVSNGTNVTEISIPNTTDIVGNFKLTNNPNLSTYDFSSLSTIGGDFEVSNSGFAGGIDITSLTNIGGKVRLFNNPNLDYVNFTTECPYNSLDVYNNPILTTIPTLPDVPSLTMSFINIVNCPQLDYYISGYANVPFVSGNIYVDTINSLGLGIKNLNNLTLKNITSIDITNGNTPIVFNGNLHIENCGPIDFYFGYGVTFSGSIYVDNLSTLDLFTGYERNYTNYSSKSIYFGPATTKTADYKFVTGTLSNSQDIYLPYPNGQEDYTPFAKKTAYSITVENNNAPTNGLYLGSALNYTISNNVFNYGGIIITTGSVSNLTLTNNTGASQSQSLSIGYDAPPSVNVVNVQSNSNIEMIGEYGTCSSWTFKNNTLSAQSADNPAYPNYYTGIILDYRGCNITEVGIENLLSVFDGNGQTNKTLKLEGGTNAAPGATASGYITSLEGKGWTVTHN